MGGMGNQLFQYAFAERQRRNGLTVCFDDSWYYLKKAPLDRPYVLDKFNLDVDIIGFDEALNTIIEQGLNFEYLTAQGYNFRGYWQYLPYYKDMIPELQEMFTVKEEFLTKDYYEKLKLFDKKIIGMHVRRGDYTSKKLTLSIFYYKQALEILKALVHYDDIIIFSDDYDFCKRNFPDYICLSGKKDYLDFELMKHCTHNIISNSTFSWWGAILNKNKGKKVIAPKVWVVPKGQEKLYNPNNHYPEDWILI
jgi:hypothetical protein